ncbi:MAG: amidohydrolase family protein, partial [Alcaligenaceae bacterium]
MNSILIQGGNVLDVVTLTLAPADVLVEDGQITQIGPKLTAPAGATTVQAQGKTVMPGMIDCHTHIVASQLNLGLNANLPNALATLRAVPILAGILLRGFTTVRDAGGADWALSEATRTDIVDGPRIFLAGRALSQTGGHGDFRARTDILDPCACVQKVGNIGRVVDGVDNVRLA